MRAKIGLLILSAIVMFPHSVMPLPDRSVVVTLDDGPRSDILPEILDFLGQENIPAAFFVQGWQAQDYPHLILRVNAEGHLIGNHSYGHTLLSELVQKYSRAGKSAEAAKDAYIEDFRRSERTLKKILGENYKMQFARPRSWDITPRLITRLETLGYKVQVLDSGKLPVEVRKTRDVNTEDYEYLQCKNARFPCFRQNPEMAIDHLAENVKRKIAIRERAGITTHILVFHERRISLEALKILVPQLRKAGYRFQTLRWAWGL